MPIQTQYYSLSGGLNLVEPALSIQPGRCLEAVNYEPWLDGGYRRILGFERFDGRSAPSDALMHGIKVADASDLSVGDTVTGDTSGATSIIVGIDGNNVGVTALSGTYQVDETVNGTTLTKTPVLNDAPTEALGQAWQLVAENHYRDLIAAVPGSGPVRGVWQHKAKTYAFRDNAAGTECHLFKASSTGWTQITINTVLLRFDTGTNEIAEGDTITGATSGATGTVHRMVLQSGAWGTDDAAGYLALTAVTGTYQDDESLEKSVTNMATADGASYVHAQSPGGRYKFASENFYGGTSSYWVYGCDGVNPAFEIDNNNVLTPILMPSLTGAPSSNNPFFVLEHAGHLFLAFPGGSLQASVLGEPITFNGFLGAAEFGLSEEITGATSTVGAVLVVNTRRQTWALYGTDTANWQLKLVADDAGAIKYTAQAVGTLYSADDTGITDLRRVQAFGDFSASTVSRAIQPLLDRFKNTIVDSTVVKATNQYRLFYSDGTGVIMYVRGGNKVDFTVFDYGQAVHCVYNAENAAGKEVIFFGGDNGIVYQAERGRSFDGAAIKSWVRLPFNHLNSPRVRKRFRLVDLELEARRSVKLNIATELSYGGSETVGEHKDVSVFGGGGYWDADNWDEIYYDAQSVSTARMAVTGSGINIGLRIYHASATTEPFILQGITLHYSLRRLQR